jgi:molybdopterin-guanine dinucleotide biosynthesis protein A
MQHPWPAYRELIRQKIGAAVLVGGKSRRMGVDKALLRLGSMTLLERIGGQLGALLSRVVLVGGENRFASFGWPHAPDRFPDAGPLGGILSAIEVVGRPWTLVTSCDLPLLEPALLEHLALLALDETRAVAVVPRHEGRAEPLCALYSVASLARLRRCFERGERSPTAALDSLAIHWVDTDELQRHDAELRSFFNVNTPQDLARASAFVTGAEVDATHDAC